MKKASLILLATLVLCSSLYAGDFSQTIEGVVAAPVVCGENTVVPITIAGNYSPCPGGVYCEHYRCGEPFCCPWGYFYSNPCTCQCYRSSYDAGSDCNTYFRCN
ncbi:MAG: hypothetical protein ACPL1G_10205 [Thermodesulfovibrionales bacterium]